MVDVTFVRTSTLLVEHEGSALLTDPWFAMNLRGLPCLQRPGVALEDIPPLSLVLASHLHPDHFDRRALRRLDLSRTAVVGPAGTRRAAEGLGARDVLEVAPGDSLGEGPFSVTATEADHPDGEVNFLISCGQTTLFFGGDTRYHPGFASIGRRVRIAAAFLPVGGSLVLGRRIVMTPAEALRAALELGSETVVPIHEGGAWLSVPPLSFHPGTAQELARLARERAPGLRVLVLRPGERASL